MNLPFGDLEPEMVEMYLDVEGMTWGLPLTPPPQEYIADQMSHHFGKTKQRHMSISDTHVYLEATAWAIKGFPYFHSVYIYIYVRHYIFIFLLQDL